MGHREAAFRLLLGKTVDGMALVYVAPEDRARTGCSFIHPTPPTLTEQRRVMQPSKEAQSGLRCRVHHLARGWPGVQDPTGTHSQKHAAIQCRLRRA